MNHYYVGLDVHKASICIAVINAEGKLAIGFVIDPQSKFAVGVPTAVATGVDTGGEFYGIT